MEFSSPNIAKSKGLVLVQPPCTHILQGLVIMISMDQAPRRGPSSSPRREGAGPPSTLGGGGGLVYGSRRNGSSLTGLGDGPHIGGLGLGLKLVV